MSVRPAQAAPRRGLEHLDSAPDADRWLRQLVDEPFHEGLEPDDPVVDVGPRPNGCPATVSGHTVGVAACAGLTEPERAQVALHVPALTSMQTCWLTGAPNALLRRRRCEVADLLGHLIDRDL
jgi:hypothetical protein